MASNKKDERGVRNSILSTLAYHDIFDFPLTKEEIWIFLASDYSIARVDFDTALIQIRDRVNFKEGYFSLKGRDEIIQKRKNNTIHVENKQAIANHAIRYLIYIPTIKLIGISGGLALGDADKNDDIDLFIITRINSIFKTRLIILIILQILGRRRVRNEKNPSDKICLNYLLDEKAIIFPKVNQDIYIAHEIAQLKPIFERNSTYSKFINLNSWLTNYLPNTKLQAFQPIRRPFSNFILVILGYLVNIVISEQLARIIQLAIIKRHKKAETVTNHILAFNPNDYRVHTLKKLKLKLHELGLLT